MGNSVEQLLQSDQTSFATYERGQCFFQLRLPNRTAGSYNLWNFFFLDGDDVYKQMLTTQIEMFNPIQTGIFFFWFPLPKGDLWRSPSLTLRPLTLRPPKLLSSHNPLCVGHKINFQCYNCPGESLFEWTSIWWDKKIIIIILKKRLLNR